MDFVTALLGTVTDSGRACHTSCANKLCDFTLLDPPIPSLPKMLSHCVMPRPTFVVEIRFTVETSAMDKTKALVMDYSFGLGLFQISSAALRPGCTSCHLSVLITRP